MIFNKNNLVIASACSDGGRPEISGVLFKKDRTVATDSYILVEVVNPPEMVESISEYPTMEHRMEHSPKPFINFPKSGVIIPKKAVIKVNKNVAEIKNVNLPILNHCIFTLPKNSGVSDISTTDLDKVDVVSVKNIDGQFPDYGTIMPKSNPKAMVVKLDVKKLKQIVDIISSMELDGNQDEIELIVSGANEALSIKAKTKAKQAITALVMPIRS